MVLEWRHNKYSGNAGIFIWCPRKVLDTLPRGRLPQGIEIQILDLGYEENFLKNKKKRSDWFTSHGDVFPVGVGSMKAMNPELTYTENGDTWTVGKPTSARSFPTKRLTRPHGEWNHYYFRAINGEVRLWVMGRKYRVDMSVSRARAILSWNLRVHRLIFVGCGFGNFLKENF